MSYQFTSDEVEEIIAARALCPQGDNLPTASGNWTPLYSKLSNIISDRINSNTVSGGNLQDLINAKLWLDVAIGANGGTGLHSSFIRAFTNREAVLRRGSEFSDAEMQYSSNGVALNLWKDLSGLNAFGNVVAWTLPSISQIAAADASSIGICKKGTHLFSN